MNDNELFSATELKVLKLLGSKKITISALATAYFKGETKPLDPNAVVSSAILRINRKCLYHKVGWHIEGSGGGRGGRTVWKTKK